MRYLISVVCVLALLLAGVPSPLHAQELKLSLTLPTSYFYDVDVDPSFPTTAMTMGSIPERLQLRVPGHPHKTQTNPRLPQETEVQQMADASDGLEWDLWAPEPGTSQQPKFEVEHATPSTEQHDVAVDLVSAQPEPSVEYKPASGTPATPQRLAPERRRRIGVGVGVSLVVLVGIIAGSVVAVRNSIARGFE
jgi:hypothetical protein